MQSSVQQPVQQTPKATVPPPIDSSIAGAPGAKPTTEERQQETSTNTVQTNGGTSTDVQQPSAGASTNKAQSTSTDDDHPDNGTSTDFSDVTIPMDKQIAILEKERDRYDKANETPEQQAKREKREKSQRLMAAIGDGLRSLSNLYFTSQYAPNGYEPSNSQYQKEDARLKELKAEREANRDKYLNFAMKIGDLERERASTVRELEAQAEKMKMARERAQREKEAHDWQRAYQPDIQRKYKGEADTAETQAKIKGVELQYAPVFYQGRNNLQEERINTERARQGSLHASAAASRASAAHSYAAAAAANRSNVNQFIAYDEHGRPHAFRTKQAADYYAQQHGTYEPVETERRNDEGKVRSKTISGGGYARRPTPMGRTGKGSAKSKISIRN